ncbi:hypothetical protein [Immundisolibacter sp.]
MLSHQLAEVCSGLSEGDMIAIPQTVPARRSAAAELLLMPSLELNGIVRHYGGGADEVRALDGITHNTQVAEHAQRMVRIADGRIVGDQPADQAPTLRFGYLPARKAARLDPVALGAQ